MKNSNDVEDGKGKILVCVFIYAFCGARKCDKDMKVVGELGV